MRSASTLYIVHGSLILKEIGLSIRRFPRGIFFQYLLASPDNVSGRNLKPLQYSQNSTIELRRPHLFPEFSRGLASANKNACSRIAAVTTYPSVPICLQLVASRVVASTGLNVSLYGSYFAAGMDGQLYPNIISMLFISADVLLQSRTATAHHRLRVHLAA